MNGLIDQLKKENSMIFDTLRDVKKLGLKTREGQTKLLIAKASLLAHLKREDEELYPAIKKEAENDGSLKLIMDLFEEDMKEATDIANRFFQKYPQGGSGVEFVTDFGQLFMAMKVRIALEENLIFAEYENRSAVQQ